MFVQKEEIVTTASECTTRLKQLTDQLASERRVHENELSELKQRLLGRLNTVSMSCDGHRLREGGSWAAVMSSICRSSLINSLLYNCCHPDIVTPDDV